MNKEFFCYSNLGWVRKVYIILVWLLTLAMIGVGSSEILNGNRDGFPLVGYFSLFAILIAFSSWKHFAIVKRKPLQLVVIGVISLLYLNVVSAIILFIFGNVSKKENKEYQSTLKSADNTKK